jgi:transglutaminase-like putative cysteine protease
VDKVFSIYEAISERIRPDPRGSNDAMETWYKSAGSPLGVSRLMVSLLRSEHVPARVVTGLDLSAGPAVAPHTGSKPIMLVSGMYSMHYAVF